MSIRNARLLSLAEVENAIYSHMEEDTEDYQFVANDVWNALKGAMDTLSLLVLARYEEEDYNEDSHGVCE